jgi:hypothetical protein
MMMMTMTMTFFYSGIGTNCTADQEIVTQNDDEDEDDGLGADDDDGKDDDGTNKNHTNNNNNHSPQATRCNHKTRSTRIDLCETRATTLLRWRPTMADKATSKEDVPKMMTDGSTTPMEETSDHGGDGDLHQGRMEDDEDGGTSMPSATGTLDRKTSQASPTTCFQHQGTK